MILLVLLIAAAYADPVPASDNVLQGALSSPAAFANLFSTYEKDQGRSYVGAEKVLRAKLFRKNVRDILSLNSQKNTWQAGVNMFSDMTEEEMYSYTGANLTEALDAAGTAPEWRAEGPAAPAAGSKDWRGTAVTKVKNQGSCGSCWAFSAVGALEGAYKNRGSILKRFSEQEGLDCSMRNGCKGGWMQKVYDYAKKSGRLAPEDAIPYKGREQSCRYTSKANGLIAFRVSGYTNARGDSAHASALSSSGPLSVAYTCTKNFFKYRGGIYRESYCNGGGHAVTSVGYTSEYFLMKNSWGGSFGEKGYFRIARGNVCGITDQGWTPTLTSTGKTDNGKDDGGDDGGDDDNDNTCSDSNARCAEWAGRQPSECVENWNYMKSNCRKSCKQCDCADLSSKCSGWKSKGYCSRSYVDFMNFVCRKSCDKCGSDDGGDDGGDCQKGFKKCPDGSCVHEHWNC